MEHFPSISVRPATPNDAEFLAQGNAQMALETEHLVLDLNRVRDGVRGLLGDASRGFYLIAEVEGAPAGQMMITFEWSDWRNGTFWWIQSVYTLFRFRRRGVFRALYRHAESAAQVDGSVCGLRLYVEENNQAAQGTYRHCGMRETSYRIFEVDRVIARTE